ncbi:hypothetical protein ACVIQT_005968 [Bradyrhizobium diazoefficiens]
MDVRDGKSFYELYAEDSPIRISYEVRERVAAIFARLQTWQDLDCDWPDSFEVSVDGAALEAAPSIAWAHAQTTRGIQHSAACIAHPTRRREGCVEVILSDRTQAVWFVSSAQQFQCFFRWLIAHATRNHNEMLELCKPAFHSLDFVDGALDGIKSMSRPYNHIVGDIVRHLSAFSDHGQRIFSGPWSRVSAEFGPLGVDISDENGGTKSNRIARNERTRIHQGVETVFWWHSKIEPHRDRIHISPENVKKGEPIVVGIFCEHLTT